MSTKKIEAEIIIRNNFTEIYQLYSYNSVKLISCEKLYNKITLSIKRCKAENIETILIFDKTHKLKCFCICAFDKNIKFNGESSAYFFNLILESNNQKIIEKLKCFLNNFMDKNKVTKIIGPMHESIIFERGIRLFDSHVCFSGLAANFASIDNILRNNGFKKWHDMIEFLFTDISLNTSHLENYVLKKFKNIKLEVADGLAIKTKSKEIANFYNIEWKNNWGFFPIEPSDIEVFCDSIPQYYNSAVFAYCDNILVGFCMMFEDSDQDNLNKGARIYFIGISNKFRKTGLVILILIEGIKIVFEKGISLISCAWMLESNTPVLNLVQKILHYTNVEKRIYRIYSYNKEC